MAQWKTAAHLFPARFVCGFCHSLIASDKGFSAEKPLRRIYICPNCEKPTFIDEKTNQFPDSAPGNPVLHLPEPIADLYSQARQCVSANAPTSAVLTLRKLLMHIAVVQGAKENQTFVHYVDYLSSNGFIPPNGRGWVDHIRNKGNEANHDIVLMSRQDAEELISFSEMLLKFIYEFPNRLSKPPSAG